MAQATMNIRMDADLKKQFEAFCSEIGMTMTTAVCVFAKMAVKERRIPFEIKADPDSHNFVLRLLVQGHGEVVMTTWQRVGFLH